MIETSGPAVPEDKTADYYTADHAKELLDRLSAEGPRETRVDFEHGEIVQVIPDSIRTDEATGEPVPPLLFVQGMGGDKSLPWHLKVLAEADQRPVVGLQYKGAFAHSAKLTERPDIGAAIPEIDAEQAADIPKALEMLGIKQVDAVGTSRGAIRLVAAMKQHPELFRDVVLKDPAGQDERGYLKSHLDATREGVSRTYGDGRRARLARPEDYQEESLELGMIARLRRTRVEQRSVARAQLHTVLANIDPQVHVTVLSDSADKAFRSDRLERTVETARKAGTSVDFAETAWGHHGFGGNPEALTEALGYLRKMEQERHQESTSETDDPLVQGILREREIDYARHLVEQVAAEAASKERLQPAELADEHFEAEMANERRLTDPETGLEYGVFFLNQDAARDDQDTKARPLVLALGLSSTATAGPGRDVVHEFATHIKRPIIVIDNEATGNSSVPSRDWLRQATVASIGKSRLRLLDQLGVEDFDVAGYSFGGVVAASLAREAGERAHTLVTIEAPGFEGGTTLGALSYLRRDKKTYEAGVEPELVQRVAATEKGGAFNLKNLPTMVRMLQLMNSRQATSAIDKLSLSTYWSDIVGSGDDLSGWRAHFDAVRSRRRDAVRNGGMTGRDPRVSDMLILGKAGHHDIKARRALMAETVAAALERQAKRESPSA